MKKLTRGTIGVLLAAAVLLAGSQAAAAQAWSWNGTWSGSGGWSVWKPAAGSPTRYVSTPGWIVWSWPGTGSGGGWWLKPQTPSPAQPGGGSGLPDPKPDPAPPATGGATAEEQYLINAANTERAAAGRARLTAHATLISIARTKARDMAVNGYFDHISPTYGSPRDMMLAAGLNPRTWGENIGRGGSVEQLHQAFMASPGHRANILSAGFTHMGAGVVRQGGRVYVAEEFMQPR